MNGFRLFEHFGREGIGKEKTIFLYLNGLRALGAQ